MTAYPSNSPRQRSRTSRTPLLIDVRRREALLKDTKTIGRCAAPRSGAAYPPGRRASVASSVVVFCVHGHEVSQGVAKALREQGREASSLEGGIADGWTPGGTTDAKPAGATTRWVTRERPKIDRMQCPWLISRFVDRERRVSLRSDERSTRRRESARGDPLRHTGRPLLARRRALQLRRFSQALQARRSRAQTARADRARRRYGTPRACAAGARACRDLARAVTQLRRRP